MMRCAATKVADDDGTICDASIIGSNRIAGVSITVDALTKRPSFSLSLLDKESGYTAFVEAMAWVAETMNRSHAAQPY